MDSKLAVTIEMIHHRAQRPLRSIEGVSRGAGARRGKGLLSVIWCLVIGAAILLILAQVSTARTGVRGAKRNHNDDNHCHS